MSGFTHVIGFDDAPFAREHRGDVLIVGTVYCGARLDGVVSGKVRRDGANATAAVARLVAGSRFAAHVQLIMLQGIAFAGFNVIDMRGLHRRLGLPVMAVARRAPDMEAVRRALIERVRGGVRKWALIERVGAMEPVAGVFVQRVGLTLEAAREAIVRFAVNGVMPEPLRSAHLIAGGIAIGESRGRA